MTTLAEIENAVRQYFSDNWATTDIAWPNREYAPTTGVPWVAVSIFPGTSFEEEIGQSSDVAGHRTGVLIVGVFTPLSGGTLTASAYSDQVELLFRRKTLSGVFFGEPYSSVNGSDGSWHHITVKCPFWAWNG
jgi:hypothetical protein